jgi:tetratricopeptide (TPR) repeat protein
MEGKCLSFGKGIPYHPISDILKGNFDIKENETDDLLYGRGLTLMDMGQGKYALKEFKEAEILVKQEGEVDLIIQVLFSEAAAAWRGHEISQMRTILEELESIVSDNANNLLGVVIQQSWCSFGLEDLNTLLSKEKRLRDLLSKAPNSKFAPEACYNIGLFHRWRGDIDKCIEVLESALPVLKSSAKLDSFLGATFHHGLALGERGKYQQAISVLKEGQKFGQKSGEQYNIPKLTNSLGWIFHELCQYEKALKYNITALDSIKGLLGPGTSTLFEIESQTRINIAENYLMLKEHKSALDHLKVVYNNAQKPEYYLARWRWKPRCLIGLVETWLAMGDLEKAEEYFLELAENPWLNEFPFKKYQVNTLRLQSHLLMQTDKFHEAEIQMKSALSLANQLGNPTLLWRTHQSLGKLYLKFGTVKDAKLEFNNALNVVNEIANDLTDPVLKRKYLQSDTFQKLANQAYLD